MQLPMEVIASMLKHSDCARTCCTPSLQHLTEEEGWILLRHGARKGLDYIWMSGGSLRGGSADYKHQHGRGSPTEKGYHETSIAYRSVSYNSLDCRSKRYPRHSPISHHD